MKIAYKHLIGFIPSKPSLLDISEKFFQLGHEHEIIDDVFDMDLTPNRGDCLSVMGLLRDLAVFYDVDLDNKVYTDNINSLELDFINYSKESCPFISFLKIEIEDEIGSYKGVLKDYFDDLGINKNNFFTDVSNYISYETGQPTHCYDANKINDRLLLKTIDDDEEFETLLGKKIQLHGKNLVFMQNKNVINLAGVIGGNDTSCSKKTNSVIVECAYFDPEIVIGKSTSYDINSEAAHKFERGVDPLCHEKVLRRFIHIVGQHSKIKNIQIFKKSYQEWIPTKISANSLKINKILGTSIDSENYEDILLKLGFTYENNKLLVPSYRSDIKTENDIAEEVARVIGYNNILPTNLEIPEISGSENSIKFKDFESHMKAILLDNGFFEVINNPFVNDLTDDSIKVDNPIDSNKPCIRTSLKKSLIENLLYNERRQKDSIKLFEISDIYFSNNKVITDKKSIGIICSGRVGKNYNNFSKILDVNYLKNILNDMMPEMTFNIENIARDNLDTKIKNPIAYVEFEINSNIESKIEHLENKNLHERPINFIKYKAISEYPVSKRDLSFSVRNEKAYIKLQNYLLNYTDEIIKEIFVFDFFHNKKNNEIKIGFRFIFQSPHKTITDEQVNNIMNSIIDRALSIDSVEIPGLVR